MQMKRLNSVFFWHTLYMKYQTSCLSEIQAQRDKTNCTRNTFLPGNLEAHLLSSALACHISEVKKLVRKR